MQLQSILEQSDISISDKGKAIAALINSQDKLFSESQEIHKQITDLNLEYQKKMRELSNKQEAITEKLAAVSESLQKLVR